MDLESTLLAFTQLGATWVLWALVGLSVVCLAVISERAFCFATSRGNPEALLGELEQLDSSDSVDALRLRLSESPSLEARVTAAGLSDGEDAELRMKGAEHAIRLELEKNLLLLGTVGANAPFLGLLGTVIGIIGAFAELQRTNGMLSDVLMAEIGEALVATAVGLLVALPCVAAFNLFRGLVERRMRQVEMLQQATLSALLRVEGAR
jgi:biopolymer transport protein ExbB